MISYYGYEIWCHNEHVVYQFFSETIKVDLVDKMKCYSSFQAQKIPILAVFTWFIISVTSQASSSATTDKIYLIF